MQLHPEDPRLTAYLLGELPADDAAAVERAVAADPALQSALKDLETIQQLLTHTLAPKPASLLPDQRENIRRAIPTTSAPPSAARGLPRISWMVSLAAAAAILIAAGVFLLKSGVRKPSAADTPPMAVTPRPDTPGPMDVAIAPAPTANPALNTDLPALPARCYLAAVDYPTLDLPIHSGNSSLDSIRQAILTRHEMPHRDSVRLEEILNCFSFRPSGVTVVARLRASVWHPDNRSDGSTSHAATIATETLACPWKPSASLVLVSIRGNPYNDCEIKAVFRANPAGAHRYRLLGFSAAKDRSLSPPPTRLPAKSSTNLMIEIEPSSTHGDLGMIEWTVNGEAAAPIALVRHGDAEPSNDARFAALVCTYAQWLTGDPNAMIDTELLAALARETASESLSGDHAEFLNLIDQSLHL